MASLVFALVGNVLLLEAGQWQVFGLGKRNSPKVKRIRTTLDVAVVSQACILLDSEMVTFDLGPPSAPTLARGNSLNVSRVENGKADLGDWVRWPFDRLDVDADEDDIMPLGVPYETEVLLRVLQHQVSVPFVKESLERVALFRDEAGLDELQLVPPLSTFRLLGRLVVLEIIAVDGGPWSNVERSFILGSSEISWAWCVQVIEPHEEPFRVHAQGDLERNPQFKVDVIEEGLELGCWDQEARVSCWFIRVMEVEAEMVSTRQSPSKRHSQVPNSTCQRFGKEWLCLHTSQLAK